MFFIAHVARCVGLSQPSLPRINIYLYSCFNVQFSILDNLLGNHGMDLQQRVVALVDLPVPGLFRGVGW